MSFWQDLFDKGAVTLEEQPSNSSFISVVIITTIISGLTGYEQISILIDRILGPTRYLAEIILILLICYVVYVYIVSKRTEGEIICYKYSSRDRTIAKAGTVCVFGLMILLSYSLWQDLKPLPRLIEAKLLCEDGGQAKDYQITLIGRNKKPVRLTGYQITDDLGYFTVKSEGTLSRNSYLEFESPNGRKTRKILREYNTHKNNNPDDLYYFTLPLCD